MGVFTLAADKLCIPLFCVFLVLHVSHVRWSTCRWRHWWRDRGSSRRWIWNLSDYLWHHFLLLCDCHPACNYSRYMFVTHGETESITWQYKDLSATVIAHWRFNQDTRADHEAQICIVYHIQLAFICMLFFLVSVKSTGSNWIGENKKISAMRILVSLQFLSSRCPF